MPKTIIVANRLPVKIQENHDQYTLIPSEGGLATGLGSVYKQGNNVWIGWPGQVIPENKRPEVGQKLQELSLVPVYLTQDDVLEFYEGFSNDVLWPVFHYYASTYTTYKPSHWDYYQSVNEKFKEVIMANCEPGDTIWIHDYQLLLLPSLIRRERPDVSIGFFLHIPFPSHEMFRLIPWRAELLQGMLGADLIGFHTFDDVRHFLSSVSRILPVPVSSNMITSGERSVIVESFPMGIDEQKYASMTYEPEVIEQAAQIRQIFKGGKIILAIDRLDYSKGILQRLQALELLLEEHPEYIGNVTLYMVVVPSRDTVPQYMYLHDQIDKKVGNINAKYRTMDWTPVSYYYRSVPLETLSALYSTADVCLVNPMRDGMNLVSKEYVASRTNNDGVLILSEMAGASRELIDALLVNPNNVIQVKDAIIEALAMPLEEQQRRMKQMRQLVAKFNVNHWVQIFMERLNEVKLLQRSMQTRHVHSTTAQSIINRYHNTGKRIIFLDYDGTLVEFKPNVDQAVPDRQLYDLLAKLSADPNNQLVLISGRKHENLGDWFGDKNIYLIAEHGAWFKPPQQEWHKINGLSTSWKKDIHTVLEKYVDRTPGSFIEEKTYSLVWHYRKAQRGLGELRANELMNTLKFLATDKGLQLLPGDKVVEIKNMEINKGKAALSLVDQGDWDFIMALGDDVTDEDLFKALPESSVTIKVGSGASVAKFYVRNPKEVRGLLTAMTVDTQVAI
ncbi:bifunctional alpha,alpha-trehalose-phosphate synthase (UDP-forming)/trehalose-phosphatase [Mucilaginibacter daejeonensis]|uniref:bifunctional alpha,alpha-trehalose-phosphate synthase (UDP-forming)/trehalose-phosphatase n=1 Tax=Mucilaginibacter daejeonensis TaxID=398049 RepID=UPI001D17527E|nr:bifunctional alpha,alpha-trehalose-phosphate synthase (UDP-forming)/trehalose-phosphatase [Mucilaginibacter daejeonensis]UEG55058.1 bifunctional alpha,alpha-trehalose-phosphate synthase (UDP-forming)/trehalose-phosphatase [Mucilaginibacter daejeonensis]